MGNRLIENHFRSGTEVGKMFTETIFVVGMEVGK